MAFWNRKEEPQALKQVLPSADTTDLEQELKNNFGEPSQGNYFRTRTFAALDSLTEQSVWFEARRIRNEGWMIRQVTRAKGPGQAEPSDTFQNLVRRLKFFQAIEFLAEREITQQNMNYKIVDQPDLATLGRTYFIPFAISEGIVFDTEGRPHPTTEDGSIITNAAFPLNAEETARTALQKKRAAFEPQSLIPLLHLETAPDDLEAFNHLIRLRRIVHHVRLVRNYVAEANKKGWWHDTESEDYFLTYADLLPGVLANVEEKFSTALREIFNKESPIKSTLMAEFNKGFNLIKFYAWLSYAHDLQAKLGQSFVVGEYAQRKKKEIFTYTDDKLQHAENTLVEILKEIGGGQNSPEIAGQKLIFNMDKNADYTREMDQVVEWFQYARAELKSKKGATLSPSEKALLARAQGSTTFLATPPPQAPATPPPAPGI